MYKAMRQILTFLCALAVMASCSTTRGVQARVGDGGNLHPDDVFTITEDDIARETRHYLYCGRLDHHEKEEKEE